MARRSLPPILISILLAAAHVGTAAAMTQDEITHLKGPDRQKILEDGARKEGVVTFYTSLVVDQLVVPIKNAFEAKYPYIKLEFIRGDTAQLMQRVLSETRAKSVKVDVIVANLAEAYKRAGLAQSFSSPLMDEYPPEYIDPDRTWMAIRTQWSGLGWNTKLVKDGDEPKTWDDLLDPKWKSKMVWAGSSTTGGPRLIVHFRKMWGDDKAMAFLEKLKTQDIRTLPGSVRTVLDQVIAGEAPLGLNMDFTHVVISRAAGAPVAGGSPDPVLTRTGTMHVVKGGPHPHAGMLLADFLMMKEGGQKVLQESNYNPSHPAIEAGPALRWAVPRLNGKKELVIEPVEEDRMVEESVGIYQKLFR